MGVSTGIRVDLTALTGVLTDLRRDVDQGLTPSTHGATGDLGDAACFGGSSASGEVIAGATDVSYAASIAGHNVGVHIENAYAIATMIEFAVTGYRLADAVVSEDFSTVSNAPVGSVPASTVAGLTPVFVGPLPAPKIPSQALTQSPHALNWESFDTPRIWTMVSGEVSDAAWRQMRAFRLLSEALSDQHRRMLALRERLVEAWTPQGAAVEVLARWDSLTAALESDSMCAYMTAKAMEGILEALSEAREKIVRFNDTWTNVTTDYLPEWWDHKAELTNEKARIAMLGAERAVADHRRRIAVPSLAATLLDDSDDGGDRNPSDGGGGDSGKSTDEKSPPPRRPLARGFDASIPPPLPGLSPTLDGPGLAGSPSPVGVSAATPPSTLPIPPGVSELAPGGGAYILPNRWLTDGRVLSMPGSKPSAPGNVRSGIAGQPGGVPGMIGVPGWAGGSRAGEPTKRIATEQWEVAVGVPPVIKPPEVPDVEERREVEVDEELERFREWYRELSMPWAPNRVSNREAIDATQLVDYRLP